MYAAALQTKFEAWPRFHYWHCVWNKCILCSSFFT